MDSDQAAGNTANDSMSGKNPRANAAIQLAVALDEPKDMPAQTMTAQSKPPSSKATIRENAR